MRRRSLLLMLVGCVGLATLGAARGQVTPAKGDTRAFVSGFAPAGDVQLYYEVHGSGEPIVFVHGGGEKVAYLPALNDGDEGVRVIEGVVRRELQGWA